MNETDKNSPTFIALFAFWCVGSLRQFYTTNKHSLETDFRMVPPTKNQGKGSGPDSCLLVLLLCNIWERQNHNKAVEICLLAQFSHLLWMFRLAGLWSCVKRWPILAPKGLKDAFMILQEFRIISFNWSSYDKTFTRNRSLRLEVAHFFFWKFSNISLKKKLFCAHISLIQS